MIIIIDRYKILKAGLSKFLYMHTKDINNINNVIYVTDAYCNCLGKRGKLFSGRVFR